MIVPVLHPAPVTHVPPRGRVPRHDLVAVRTPVELREASLSETAEAGAFRAPMGNDPAYPAIPVRAHGGRSWIPVPSAHAHAARATVGDLAGYLSGSAPGSPARAAIAAAFSQTPVSARFDPDRAVADADPARGTPEGGMRYGRIVRDGREAASAAVREHLAAEILLVEGQPWIRFRPILTHAYSGTVGFDVALDRLSWNGDGHQAYDPADHDQAAVDWHVQPTGTASAAAAAIARLQGPGTDGHALLHNLNRLPRQAAAALQRLADADRAEIGAPREATMRLLLACEALSLAARIGGIGPQEAASAARTLARSYGHLLAHDTPPRSRWTLIGGERYLTRFAIPRAEALAEPEPEDLDALRTLGR